jgi:hypothetical protein
MAIDQSQHETFYRAIHACIMAHITEDAAEMAAFHTRFEKNPDDWTRAMACGFYRMGYTHLGLVDVDTDFYDLTAKKFVELCFAEELKEDAAKYEVSMQLGTVRKGFDAVLKYDQVDAALSVDEIKNMAVGLGKLVLFYPPFYDESQREGILEDLSFNVTEDILGEWPAE